MKRCCMSALQSDENINNAWLGVCARILHQFMSSATFMALEAQGASCTPSTCTPCDDQTTRGHGKPNFPIYAMHANRHQSPC